MNRLLIFIPTYNESENVEEMVKNVFELGIDGDLLVADDNSPDGTGEILEKLRKIFPKLIVVHREKKLGIGNAHKFGISYAYEKGYEYLLTMDCDFTHSPSDIPLFLENSEYDIVIGTRYTKEDSLKDWNIYRRFLTKLGHFLTKYLLGMDYDATGAFRLYNLKKIDKKVFDKVRSDGYSFFFESLFFLNLNGYKIKEIPIVLPKRTYGHSKMTIKEIFKSLYKLFNLFLYRLGLKR
ncbi:MAG: polyprenol monophosphomannose synthase [Proteobacteria bacterium]|nr:polyprenol monophosphomannose synthase [Pseudomonadota bacterium]